MILINNKVVIAIMDKFEVREAGNYINGAVFPFQLGEVIEIEVPDYVIPHKYCYTPEQGFYINEVWLNSKQQLEQTAIDAYTLELIEGGVL